MKDMNFAEMRATNGGSIIVTLGLIAAGVVVVKEICDIVKTE